MRKRLSNISEKNINIICLINLAIYFLLLIISCNIQGNMEWFSAAVWSLPSGLLVLILSLGNEKSKMIKSLFENNIVQFLGSISYELCMFHYTVLLLADRLLNNGMLPANYKNIIYILSLFISIGLAVIYKEFIQISSHRKD